MFIDEPKSFTLGGDGCDCGCGDGEEKELVSLMDDEGGDDVEDSDEENGGEEGAQLSTDGEEGDGEEIVEE